MTYARLFLPLLCALLALAVQAQPTPYREEPLSTPQAPESQRIMSFKQLGKTKPIQLRGVDGVDVVEFGVRSDEVVNRAVLHLSYHYSPSLIPHLSHLKVYLNDVVVATLPFPKEYSGQNLIRDVELDARFLSDFNRIKLQLIGHYTLECEDPLHTSLWTNISNTSTLELGLTPLKLDNDLALLPVPFFDRRDNRRLELPFVLAASPSLGTLKAAGVLSSWFGALADYRGARFPVHLDRLPGRHAVVLATNDERPSALRLPVVQGPTLYMIDNPALNGGKLLLVQGRDHAELLQAAQALALGQTALSGPAAAIRGLQELKPRQPYDAPRWLPTDRAVKFGELASLADLQVSGYAPDLIRVNFRIAPDIFTWRSKGIPVDLKYRFTPPPKEDKSTLNVNINDGFVQSFQLLPSGKLKLGVKEKINIPLLDDGTAASRADVIIPPFHISGRNQLQFHYYFDYHKEGPCKDVLLDNQRGVIDADSTIDFSPFPHYAAMPNLSSFANAGFPFTRMADLSETAVIIPDAPDAKDLEAYLFVMGRMGEATGYPALKVSLGNAARIDQFGQYDLVLVGGQGLKDLLTRWRSDLPSLVAGLRREINEASRGVNLFLDWFGFSTDPDPSKRSLLEFDTEGGLGALIGFESPYSDGRSVVAVTASSSAFLGQVLDAMEDPATIPAIKGSLTLVQDRKVHHALVGDTYFIGHLPLTTSIWWFISRHPLLMVLMVLLAASLVTFLVYRALKTLSERRLKK